MKYRDYQEKMHREFDDAWDAGAENVMGVLPTGGGKCLGRGTPVLMFDGTVVPVESVREGDCLMGPDSRPRVVKGVTRGVGELFKITQGKGDSYVVNGQHVLSLKRTGLTSGGPKGAIVNLPVADYLARSKTFKHTHKGWKTGVDFPPKCPLPLDPYFVGLWLGDGTRSTPHVTTADPEIVDYLRGLADAHGLRVSLYDCRPERNCWCVRLVGSKGRENPITTKLRKLGIYDSKAIPHAYLTASRDDRLRLLAGLLDSDGYYTGKGFDVSFVLPGLMEGLVFLTRSLGKAAKVGPCRKECVNTGRWGDYYRCSLSGDFTDVPFIRNRHREGVVPRRQKKDPLVCGVRVEPIGEGDYFGFEVDGDHLFLLGDFTVTHNSSLIAGAAHHFDGPVCAIAHRQELVSQISIALARYGVEHRLIAAESTVRNIVRLHMDEFGRSFYNPRAPHGAASVDTLIRVPESDRWLPSVKKWVVDECFPAGTMVGDTPIERVRVGDSVPTFDEATGEVRRGLVTHVFESPMPDDMVRLLLPNGRTLYCTLGHPIFTRRGWVDAAELRRSDEVLVDAGAGLSAWGELRGASLLKREDFPEARVYNLEVEGTHTYLTNGLVVHNCHHLVAEGGTKGSVNKWMKAAKRMPHAKGLGLTATPLRADGKGLGRCSDGVMDEMICGPEMRELIQRGYLTDYDVYCPPNDLDLAAVRHSASGDFSPDDLRKAVHSSRTIVGDVVSSYLRIAPGKRGVTFCVDIEAATEVCTEFRRRGVPAEVLTGKTPDLLRAQILRGLRDGKILQVVSVDVLSEGFDLPAIEVVSFARPTDSLGLYRQQFGRVLRTMPGKERAIVIDHVGNVVRHRPPDALRAWSLDRRERKSKGAPDDLIPMRSCPQCTRPYERTFPACPFCGHVVVPAERSAPQHVDGDLVLLTPDVLAKLRGEIDAPLRIPYGATPAVEGALRKHHSARNEAQAALRAAMDQWAGYRVAAGEADPRAQQRRFFLRFGVDVLSAQALSAREANELRAKIEANFQA